MPRAVHPALNGRLRDLFSRIPFVRGVVTAEDHTIVQIVLENVFRQSFSNIVADIFSAGISAGAASVARTFSIRVDVIEETPVRHVAAVDSGYF